MSRQIIIGKEGTQPFAIQDPKVSRRHAILEVGDGGQLRLIDNSSTNGTYIYNGSTFVRLYANQPYNVQPDSMIQLGPDTRFHVRRLLSNKVNAGAPQQNAAGQAKPNPKPKKRVDISALRLVSEQYDARKMELESKAGMINGLRSCTVIITMAAGTVSTIITNNSGNDSDSKIISSVLCIGIAFVLMAVLLVIINNFNKKLMKRRKDNDHDYAVKYVCPECHVSFRGKIYENILAERCCPKCKTEYYDKNVKS